MFIARGIHQITKAPEGRQVIARYVMFIATRWTTRGISPTIDTAQPIVPHLAPRGDMFIARGIHQITKAPEGRQVIARYVKKI